MKSTVILKGNKYGFQIVLNPEVPFEKLNEELSEKLKDSSRFFQEGKKIAVSFTGRILTAEEQNQLIDTITCQSTLNVICVLDGARELEWIYQKALLGITESKDTKEEESQGLYYRGNLSPGEILEADRNIIVLGDVMPGSKLISSGNITILGELKGRAHAGYPDHEDAWITALKISSTGIQIGRTKLRLSQLLCLKKVVATKNGMRKPQIVRVQNGFLCIDDVIKSLVHKINLC